VATIKTRRQKDGTPSYRAMWRQGGTRDGSWESETFLRKTEATRFRRDVDAAGQDWPEGWVKGVGYVEARAQPVTEVPFLPYARAYVRDLTGITPATRHRYDRQVLALAQQLVPIVAEDVTVANVEEAHVRRWVNAREAAHLAQGGIGAMSPSPRDPEHRACNHHSSRPPSSGPRALERARACFGTRIGAWRPVSGHRRCPPGPRASGAMGGGLQRQVWREHPADYRQEQCPEDGRNHFRDHDAHDVLHRSPPTPNASICSMLCGADVLPGLHT
jgi:hypothetical protein